MELQCFHFEGFPDGCLLKTRAVSSIGAPGFTRILCRRDHSLRGAIVMKAMLILGLSRSCTEGLRQEQRGCCSVFREDHLQGYFCVGD